MYVVIDSIMRPEIRPFGGCYKVHRITDSNVWYERTRKDENEIVRVSRSRVLFFTDKDITECLNDYNTTIEKSMSAHKELVNRVLSLAKEHATPAQP